MRQRIWAAVGLTALAMGAHSAETKPTVRIASVNLAKADQKTVARGKDLAAYVLAKAGIAIVWQEKGWQENAPDYWLVIAGSKPLGTLSEGLGYTVRDTETGESRAGIYYPGVTQTALQLQTDESGVLGAVMAREIGHLLGESHALAGVMTPVFSRQQIVDMGQGWLNFTPAAAARMRDVARRGRDTAKLD